ncbi:MAG: hypothetical protein PVF27_08180 [Gemmatimonadales bacterium]|jgi:hypothetical protein
MTDAGRERLRFLEFEFSTDPDGRCHARVILEGEPGAQFVGEADGLGSRAAELRCAAQAATTALQRAVGERLALDLLGVKAVRAFDSVVVIVSLSCHNGMPASRLVGSCLTDGEEHRCAALAVLNATNRLLGNIIFMR